MNGATGHGGGRAGAPLGGLALCAGVTASLALWWIARCAPDRIANGQRTGEQRDLERLLDQRDRELRARTAELLERTAELRERSADLQAVAGTLAHDLRNSLNTLGLNVHLLRTAIDHGDRDVGAMALEHMDRARQQMLDMLDSLRRLSRATFSELAPVELNVAALARAVGRELAAAEAAPELRLEVVDLPACRADPALARMVFESLLENAARSARGSVERLVEVGFHPGSPVVYYVRDSGRGFDAAEASMLFEPFRRRRAGAPPDVGLAVAARALARHGGRVWAETGDSGTTFYFDFGPDSA